MADISDISSVSFAEQGPDIIALFFHCVNVAREKGLSPPKSENFEANFVELMQRWAASPQYGILVDATTKSELHNVASFLGDALFGNQPCPDPRTRLTQNELDHLLNFAGLSYMLGGFALKIGELPPSAGYEPMLLKHGFNPIGARGLAHILVKSGKRQAKEEQLRPSVVKAIRGLALPHTEATLIERARYLIQVADESSVVDTICCEVGLREMDLLPLLQDLIDRKPINQSALNEILERLKPALSVRRGPKRSAASAAHELLLDPEHPIDAGRDAYTWSEIDNDFTDPLTEATRVEFGDPHFDPRPARRRLKKRRLAETD